MTTDATAPATTDEVLNDPALTNHEALEGIFAAIRAAARTERDKGTAFERLVQTFLQDDPKWKALLSDVWMWSEWPGRNGEGDTGIDLVAREAETGDLWAIQAKFYSPEHTLQKADIDAFFTASGKLDFAHRAIVSTTDKWSKNAEAALQDQQIPVERIRALDMSDSSIDWSTYSQDQPGEVEHLPPRELRPHQREALTHVQQGFARHDRGKLIMACGTGKTFTALAIAEDLAGAGGRVLFLVPSISLLQQTLNEWTKFSEVPLRSFAVCSDTKVGKKHEDISVHDLQYPATTSAERLAQHASAQDADAMTVVFSTYQSIQVVAEAQTLGLPDFDVIICDEAHRTTGVTLADADESNFVRVHDESYIHGAKRLYMTATPRIYSDDAKAKAVEVGALAASMDDESVFGPEFHRLGFGEAVERGLLSDYKVLVLAVDEKYVAKAFQRQLADENHELKLDDAAKIVGCWNGLARRQVLEVGLTDEGDLQESDGAARDDGDRAAVAPMRRAVAFSRSIKDSQRLADQFQAIIEDYTANSDNDDLLGIQAKHVDGTFNVLARNARIDWLEEPTPDNTCRVLSNARCLSEGVDVPALDAVLFLNPRNSTVDVVQSVGRVMRKHPDKQYGYVILPIGIPADMAPEDALADHQRYKVVWQVLQALRAHDDRFNAMINKIELNGTTTDQVQIIGVSENSERETGETSIQATLPFPQLDEWRDAILTKLVQKVGDRRYWEDWASDIAQIADRHITRITAILDDPNAPVQEEFEGFLTGLRGNLNDSISRDEAIEMLAQHLITKPVFDALFEDYFFAASNPVSQVMQHMLDALDEYSLDTEAETLERFYESVRMRASGIDTAIGKQRIVTELYEKFFKNAFPRMTDKLGIVYTPPEIVDYILHSVQHVLQTEFDTDLSAEDVHVLDPFTGTGTFIVRLLESGLITPEALPRKYRHELHAIEIVLLAYYIAAINIEATYHGVHGGEYEPFNGIVLGDTFQMAEDGDPDDLLIFPINNERVEALKRTPIKVIVGNPPYSVGQRSQNDNNQNMAYPTLDARIARTYAERASGTNLNSLYDSYIRAFRWASDRIEDDGVVAFVSNGSWIDGIAADGFRKSLASEFSAIWVFNLRGNARTQGETRRKEKGNVFGEGSRTPVTVTVLVKHADHVGPATIHYRDIGDYLTREQKLSAIAESVSIATEPWERIQPNNDGDWISQRDETFATYQPLGDKRARASNAVFDTYSLGIKTQRDAWAVNSSADSAAGNMQRMIGYYEDCRAALGPWCTALDIPRNDNSTAEFVKAHSDPTQISWTRSLKADLRKDKAASFDQGKIVPSLYRPFFKQHLYFDRQFNEMVYQIPRLFPHPEARNLVISAVGTGASRPFSVLMADLIPNLDLIEKAQCFPLHIYERSSKDSGPAALFETGASADSEAAEPDAHGYVRRSAITDHTLAQYRDWYGSEVTPEDVFYFVYGFLHSPEYVTKYAADLRKMIPRIPRVDGFWEYSKAGRALGDLHVGYENVDRWPLDGIPAADATASSLYVQKMKFAGGARSADKSAIIVNPNVTLSGIPAKAYEYTVNGKSAIEWLIDRYQVKTDKASQIVNDPNTYSDDPRYIVDLIPRIVTVSMKSVELINTLPTLRIID